VFGEIKMETLNLVEIIIGAVFILAGLGIYFVLDLSQTAQFYGAGFTILIGIILILIGFFYKKK